MIRKGHNGWNLYSEKTGKKLNKKPFGSKAAAQKRERQINFFKNRGRY